MDNILKNYLKLKGDYVIWVIYLLLIMLSVSIFYSAASPLIVDSTQEFIKHIIFLLLGFGVLMAVYSLPRQYMKIIAWAMLAFAFVLQIAAYTPLGSDDHRRILFLQPSEIAKFALIVISAYFIDRFQDADFLRKNFKWFFMIIWVPLLIIIPTNGSMGIIIIVPILLMMMIGSIPWKKIRFFIGVPMLIVGVFCAVALMIPDETYKKYASPKEQLNAAKVAVNTLSKVRVHTWTNRTANWLDGNMNDEQSVQARCAIYDGKHPTGPGNSVWRNHIVQGWSDYIFAIIIEEYGIIGAFLVSLLFLWLLFRAGVLVRQCKTVYSAIVIVGATTVIIFQAFVHIGVCTGLIPATGQPLPLISKGGTSILIISAFFGLMLGMSREVEDVKNENVPKNNLEKNTEENTENIDKKTETSDEKPEEILNEKFDEIEKISDEIIEISESNDDTAKTIEIEL